jgi:outer membrane receptor for Fe3+-dicitrate
LRFSAGITLAKDSSPQPELDEDYLLPKLGVDWKKSDQLHLRVAAFRTLQSNMTASFYQTLEPTQFTGFNQFLDEPNHSLAWNYGLRLEGSLNSDIAWGISHIYRDGEIPLVVRDFSAANPADKVQAIKTSRNLANLYVSWTIHSNLAVSAGYSNNRFVLHKSLTSPAEDNRFSPDGIERLETHKLPFTARYFHPSGFGLEATATHYDQQGDFILNQPGSIAKHGSDRFWLANLTASYRLSKRRGNISVGINNLFDQSFQFEDIASNDAFLPLTTAAPSTLNQERLLFGKISLNFR